MPWSAQDIPDQTGRVVVVTGSNTGIGLATVRFLASCNARIVIACRNTEKGCAAQARISAAHPGADVGAVQLDLGSLGSVRRCAAAISERYDRVDLLINNAGVMMPPLVRTTDGFESQFATNVLGHFALTGLLMPSLERAGQARVVNVSSVAHWFGRIDFANLNAERRYSAVRAYGQSKLANILLAYEMQRRLGLKGSAVQSLAAHPGGAQSELDRHSRGARVVRPLLQPVEDAALPALRAGVDPTARGGDYFGPSGLATMSGPPGKQRSSRRSHCETTARALWSACERLTGVSYLCAD